MTAELVDVLGTWPAGGVNGTFALRCSRCGDLVLGKEGDKHWRDKGIVDGKRHLSLCRSRDGTIGYLEKQEPRTVTEAPSA